MKDKPTLLTFPKTNDLGFFAYRRFNLPKFTKEISDFLQKHYKSVSEIITKKIVKLKEST